MNKPLLTPFGAAVLSVAATLLSACGGGSASDSSLHATVALASSSSSSSSSSESSSSDSSSSSSGGSFSPTAGAATSGAPAGYQLVWADEFNGSGLPDSTKWIDDVYANTYDPINGELEYYTQRRLENEHMEGGYLYLTARKEDMTGTPYYAGQHYSSARIITDTKKRWTYGFFEVRAKLPCGAGTWPAIWMLGTNGGWPAGGEMDIMEQVGRYPTDITATVHNKSNQSHNGDGKQRWVGNACTAFHNYQLTWTSESLQFGVDGIVYMTYANAHTGHDQWPFDEPEYMLLNVAMGGVWAGPVDDTALPRSMQVDYVRVYQKS